MRALVDEWTIALVGLWNPRIFLPEWSAKHLFNGASDVELQVMVGPELSHRLRWKDIFLAPGDSRLVVHAQRAAEETLTLAEGVAVRALSALSHTPMVGVGVNFGFEVESPTLAEGVRFADDTLFSELGYETTLRERTRRIVIDGTTVNIRAVFDHASNTSRCHFNFHNDVKTCSDAIKRLENKTRDFLAVATKIMEAQYGEKLSL